MRNFYLFTFFALCFLQGYSQTKGLIYKPSSTPEGKAIMDPNKDGYTSADSTGFKTNDRGNGESEIKYQNIPILENEPIQDPLRGPACGFTDMVDSGTGDPVMFYFDGTNFLVRFRLNKTSPNSKGYSVLIDTDELFGFSGTNKDPNAVAGNPGFELEMVLESNHGVSLYNVNGLNTRPATSIVTKDYDAFSQKSIAYTNQCGDMDYFYDFYLPWSFFGLSSATKLRMVALTVMNPHPAIGNNAKSDVGGVDDRKYGGNYDWLFQDFINNFNPTAPANFSSGMLARSACPAITSSVTPGVTSISGTSTEANGTQIKVYRNGSVLGTATVSSQAWTLSGLTGIAGTNVISATATASGKAESTSACNSLTVPTACTAVLTSSLLSINDKGICGSAGAGVPGAQVLFYDQNMVLQFPSVTQEVVAADGSFKWKCNASNPNCNSGSGCLNTGTYIIRQKLGSECLSDPVFICYNTTTLSGQPVISTPITNSATSVSGTVPSTSAGAAIYLYADGKWIGQGTAASVSPFGWSISGLTVTAGQSLTARALASGKCASGLSTAVPITGGISTAPVITSTYCATTIGTALLISGTSTEANKTIIELFRGGTSLGTTEVFNGTWSKDATVFSNDVLTAKATAPNKTVSSASASITVQSATTGASLSVNGPITEGAAKVTGTVSVTGTVKLYIDEFYVKDAVVSGNTWTADNLSSYEIFAGGKVTATVTPLGGCESGYATAVTVDCILPSTSLQVDLATAQVCAGKTTSFKIKSAENLVVYELFTLDGMGNQVKSGSSKMGNGSDLTFTSSALTSDTKFYVKALKISPVVCASVLTNAHTVTVTSVITTNSVTAPNNQTNYCGATAIGDITGSDPTGGNGTYSYQWQSSPDGISWTNVGGNTKNYTPGTVSATAQFRRVVTSGACVDANSSAAITISIQPVIANTISYSGNSALCVSGSPTIITGNSDASHTSYQWQSSPNGSVYADLPGTSAKGVQYTPGTLTQTTYFRRKVSTTTCDSYSAAVVIYVYPAVSNNVLTAPSTVLFCHTGNVGEITGSLPQGGNDTYTYSWQKSTDNGVSFTDIAPSVTTQHFTPGNISATTYYRRIVESTTCPASISNTIKVEVASSIYTTMTVAAASMPADGLSTTTVTVQLKDAFSTILSGQACVLTLSTDKGTLSGVTYIGNGQYTATLTASTTAEKASITGSIGGVTLTAKTEVNFVAGSFSITKSTVVASPTSVLADGTALSTITVQLKDANGNNTTSNSVLTINSTLGNISELTDNGGGNYTAKLKSTTTGSATITASLGGSALTTKPTVNFTAGAADLAKSTIVASPTSVLADGIAFTTITVQLKDANGNNTTSTDAFVITSSLGTVTELTDNGGGNYTAKLKSTATGTATATASLAGSALTTKPTVSFTPGAADLAESTVVASPSSVLADGTAFSTITVQLKDANGNNTISSNVLAIISSLGAISELIDNGGGNYTAKVKSITTGPATITAKLGASELTTKPTVNFTAGAADLTKSTVVASPTSVLADGTAFSTINIQLKDANGNNTTSTNALTITSSLGTVTEFTDNGGGNYTAKLNSTATGMATITASLGGSALTTKPTVNFTAGAVDLAKSTVVASPNFVLADGIALSTITVQLKDANGNHTTSNNTLTITSNLGTVTELTDNGGGNYTAKLKSTSAGTATINTSLGGSALITKPTVSFISGNIDLTKSSVVASPTSVLADGTAFSTLTVQLKDANGNNITSSDALTITSNLGTISQFIDNGGGNYTAKLKSTVSGTAIITASLAGNALTTEPTVSFTAGTTDLAKSTVVASPTSVLADGTAFSTITVQLKDANGNNTVNSDAMVINSSLGTISELTNNGGGNYTAKLNSTATGMATITASLGGTSITTKPTVNFTPGTADLAKSTLIASPSSVLADGTAYSTITVQLKDANGNNTISSEAFILTAVLGNISELTDNGGGNYTAKLKSTVSGMATITASLGGSTLTTKPTVNFTAGAADLTKSTVVVSPTSVLADGTAFATITIQLKDANGNNTTSSEALTITSSLGAISELTNNGGGNYTAKLKSTSTGIATINAKLDVSELSTKPTASFTSGAADLAKSTVVASPSSVLADGTAFSTITVQLKDANGNNTTSSNTLTITSTLRTVTDLTDNGSGNYIAKLKSTTTGSATITAKLDAFELSTKPTISFTAGAADLAKSTVVASPSSVLADGTAFSTIIVQLKDANGNNTTSSDALAIASNLGTISELTDNGGGNYTAKLKSTTTGTATITASLGGNALTTKPTVSFTAGAVDLAKSTVVATPISVAADGTAFATITVQLKDANGNNTTAPATLTLSRTLGTVYQLTNHGNGNYTARIKSTATGASQITAMLGTEVLSEKPTVYFISGDVNLTISTVTANPTIVAADGTSYATITVQLKDAAGNNTASTSNIIINSSLGTVYEMTNNGNDNFTARLKSTEIGNAVITVMVGSEELVAKPTVRFIAGAANMSASVITVNPAEITAGEIEYATITVQLKDASGHPTTSTDPVSINSNLGTVYNLTNLGNGLYTAQLKSTLAGTATITAKLGQEPLTGEVSVLVAPGATNLSASTVTAGLETLEADGVLYTIITVQLKDAYGNPTISDDPLTLASSLGTVYELTDLGNGTYQAKLKSTEAGIATVTAKLGEQALNAKPVVNFAPGVPSLSKSTVVVSADNISADGETYSIITVQLKDAQGNPTSSSEALTITSSLGTVTELTNNGDGTYMARIKSTLSGTANITASLGGVDLSTKPSVNLTPGAASLTVSTIEAAPAGVPADGTAYARITVQLKDAFGNHTTSTEALSITSTLGTVYDVVNNGDGNYTARLKSTVSGTATVSAKLGTEDLAAKPSVSFMAGEVSHNASALSAQPNTVFADGQSTVTVTIRLKNAQGHVPVTDPDKLEILIDGVVITGVTDKGNGVFEVVLPARTLPATVEVKALYDGTELPDKLTVTYLKPDASALTSLMSASTTTVAADGTSTSRVTVQLKDAQGNAITTGGDKVELSTSLGTLSEVTDNGDGTYTATLTSATLAGTATISGKINEQNLTSSVQVNFTAPTISNLAPIASNDSFTTLMNQALKGNVMTNDSDPDGDGLKVTLNTVQSPLFGTLLLLADGSFTYTPNAGYIGEDSFRYQVCDIHSSSLCTEASVTIQVAQPQVFIPEGFSPDGDGENDAFIIHGADQFKVSLVIYNRWGNVVYESPEYKNNWTGIANQGIILGDKLPDGTYFYVVDLHNGEKPQTRYLTIKRQ